MGSWGGTGVRVQGVAMEQGGLLGASGRGQEGVAHLSSRSRLNFRCWYTRRVLDLREVAAWRAGPRAAAAVAARQGQAGTDHGALAVGATVAAAAPPHRISFLRQPSWLTTRPACSNSAPSPTCVGVRHQVDAQPPPTAPAGRRGSRSGRGPTHGVARGAGQHQPASPRGDPPPSELFSRAAGCAAARVPGPQQHPEPPLPPAPWPLRPAKRTTARPPPQHPARPPPRPSHRHRRCGRVGRHGGALHCGARLSSAWSFLTAPPPSAGASSPLYCHHELVRLQLAGNDSAGKVQKEAEAHCGRDARHRGAHIGHNHLHAVIQYILRVRSEAPQPR